MEYDGISPLGIDLLCWYGPVSLESMNNHQARREEALSRQNVSIEQRTLREATERYYHSLPPAHRELLHMIAADYNKPPHAIIAGAIEELITRWRSEYLAKDESRTVRRERRFA